MKKMKKVMALMLAFVMVITMMPSMTFAKENTESGKAVTSIPIDEKHFPDNNLRRVLNEQPFGEDGIITAQEIKELTRLDLSGWNNGDRLPEGKKIKSLKGIELFTELKNLDCAYNGITSLDLTKNTKLEVVECNNNYLYAIKLPASVTTMYAEFNGFDTYDNAKISKVMPDLDLSKVSDVSGGEFKNGRVVFDEDNEVIQYKYDWGGDTPVELMIWKVEKSEESLAITEKIFPDDAFREKVKDYDGNGDGLLSDSEIEGVLSMDFQAYEGDVKIKSIKGIEIFKNLKELFCEDNNISKVDLSKNVNLENLHMENNKLESLNLGKNLKLNALYCSGNKLTTLNLENNTNVSFIDASKNKISEIAIGGTDKLIELKLDKNDMTELVLPECPELRSLSVSDNALTNISIESMPEIRKIYLENNKLTSIDVSSYAKLNDLGLYNNMITKLDLTYNKELKDLDCSANKLKTLVLTNNGKLKRLDCSNNYLKNLDISACPELYLVFAMDNQIKNINTDKNEKLELICYAPTKIRINNKEDFDLKTVPSLSEFVSGLEFPLKVVTTDMVYNEEKQTVTMAEDKNKGTLSVVHMYGDGSILTFEFIYEPDYVEGDADYSEVDKAIAAAEKLNRTEYKDFSEVDAAIEAVVRGKAVSEQETVDAYAEAIYDAISRLEKVEISDKPNTPDQGEDVNKPDTDKPGTDIDKPGTDVDKPGTDIDKPGTDVDKPGTDADKPGADADKPDADKDNAADKNQQSDKESEESPKTGDESDMMMWMLLLAAAAGSTVLAKRRSEK